MSEPCIGPRRHLARSNRLEIEKKNLTSHNRKDRLENVIYIYACKPTL